MRCDRYRLRPRRLFLIVFACALLFTVWIGSFSERAAVAYAADASELVQTGVNRYQEGKFTEAVESWQLAIESYEAAQDPAAVGIVSENLARAYQQIGQTSEELNYWEKAIATAKSAEDFSRLSRLLTEQAQAYNRLGQQRRAITILCGSEGDTCEGGSALNIAESIGDRDTQLAALGSLGEAYRLMGNEEKSLSYLERGHEVSAEVENSALKAAIYNSLGNTYASVAKIDYRRANVATGRGDLIAAKPLQAKAEASNQRAIDNFQLSYQLALAEQDAATQMRSLLNLIRAYKRSNNLNAARQQQTLALNVLDQLPNSSSKAFAAVRLADSLVPLSINQSGQSPLSTENISAARALLEQAATTGEEIGNARVVSFALGKLGELEERTGQYEAALEKTRLAIRAADRDLASKDSLYLWEWQIGRIQRAQGDLVAAKQSYDRAIALLEQIRSDILNASRDLQFDFRDTVEPIYRQYAALNLKEVPKETIVEKGDRAFDEIDTTLLTLDSLKVAELQSYFANDCVIVPVARRVDAVANSRRTATISTAILEADDFAPNMRADASSRRLSVIMSLPDGSRKVSQTLVNEADMEATINDFRKTLEAGGSQYITEYNYAPSQQLYDWLIRPFAQELETVETLVFVNDGLLRSVPMAALYDGDRYLIEQFAVATTPSLTLTAPEKVDRPAALSALLMGVSAQPEVPEKSFGPLPSVEQELSVVGEQLPNSKTLLNEEFSVSALRKQLQDKDYRILHMATHGTFGFDPADNFVVVGAKEAEGKYNETLTISRLETLIRETSGPQREPIELLTLTACETAIGDNRSTLGLAGVAVRAGVRSAIATLWSVSDTSSAQLIAKFYDNLGDPELTKAQALQKAKISMIESDDFIDQHPYRWAPFTLIGNWL